MNKEVMFCYYHVLLSSGVYCFQKTDASAVVSAQSFSG